MKRLIFSILTIILFSMNGNAQINNLSDFLTISEMSEYELVQNLQYTWEMTTPYDIFLDNNKIAKEYFIFKYNRDNKSQTLTRVTTMAIRTGAKHIATELISNETELFKRIKNNLANWGFTLLYKGDYFNIYSDGNFKMKIQTVSYKDTKLPKGYYSINLIN